jgi:hypothetical protein
MAKSALEKWFDRLERKAKRAIQRQVRNAATATGQAIGRGISYGARAAVDRARVKPQKIIEDMRREGWSPKQIQERTGVPVRTQNDILKGRSNGQKHLQVLKEARKAGGKSAPPVEIVPVKSARQPGAGLIRHTKSGTTITVTPGTDPAWVARQQREAAKRGTVKVIIRNPPTPPAPQPKIDQSAFKLEVTDRKDGRHRTITAGQLQLKPGTLDKVAAALAKGDKAEAERAFRAGIGNTWYRDWLTPGSTLAQTGTMDGSGGGPEGAATRAAGSGGGGAEGGGGADAVLYDGDDGDSVIYEDVLYEGEDSDSDYGGVMTGTK